MPATEHDDDNNKAEALAALPDDIDALKALVLEHQARLAIRDTEIEHLRLLIAKLKRMQFGRSSEKLNKQVEQLELRLEELQSAEAQIAAAHTPEPREKTQPVRRPLPEHLPRKEVVSINPRAAVRIAAKRCARSAKTSPRCSITCPSTSG